MSRAAPALTLRDRHRGDHAHRPRRGRRRLLATRSRQRGQPQRGRRRLPRGKRLGSRPRAARDRHLPALAPGRGRERQRHRRPRRDGGSALHHRSRARDEDLDGATRPCAGPRRTSRGRAARHPLDGQRGARRRSRSARARSPSRRSRSARARAFSRSPCSTRACPGSRCRSRSRGASDFTLAAESCPDVLLGGASCDVIVVFTPSVAGAREGTLRLADRTVALTGRWRRRAGSRGPRAWARPRRRWRWRWRWRWRKASVATTAMVRVRMARHPTRADPDPGQHPVIQAYSSARRSWPKRVSVRRSESVSWRRM